MIKISQLTNNFPDFSVGPVDLTVDTGEFFVLLGPSGSGKTVLLESIVGVRRPDEGKIILNGVDVTKLAPENRKVGIVYQDQALFPHLSVRENIYFGLRYQRQIEKKTFSLDMVIDTLGLRVHLDKSPQALSGGERQRVALARALAIQPRVILLDEPLSALDPCFRGEIQRLLKELHSSLGTTFLMVTHDFNEAFYLADRVGVISKGTVKQVGTINDVFLQPQNVEVGKFVGMKNIFCRRDGETSVHVGNLSLTLNAQASQSAYGLRPEDIEVAAKDSFPADFHVGQGTIQSVVRQGFGCEVTIASGRDLLLIHLDQKSLRAQELAMDSPIHFGFSPASLHHFPR
ncbi:ABC transporter ATP-binding protein [Desulfotalea psychrophila]|nr:ABC transporter ATP-binding protein [Desulfotalea psychrophila]